jgi:hypothetical protein
MDLMDQIGGMEPVDILFQGGVLLLEIEYFTTETQSSQRRINYIFSSVFSVSPW